MSSHRHRRGSFIDRVLDGHARIDEFEAEVDAWGAGPQAVPLHEALGLDSTELLLVARSPDALRYVLHARRFDLPLAAPLDSQARVRAYATMLATSHGDPMELAAIDSWQHTVVAPAGQEATRA